MRRRPAARPVYQQCNHADCFSVVECAGLRRSNDVASVSVNHGGVTIVAAAGIRMITLIAVNIGFQPSTLECIAARVTTGTSSCIVIYRPQSSAVTASFFSELDDVLDLVCLLAYWYDNQQNVC